MYSSTRWTALEDPLTLFRLTLGRTRETVVPRGRAVQIDSHRTQQTFSVNNQKPTAVENQEFA